MKPDRATVRLSRAELKELTKRGDPLAALEAAYVCGKRGWRLPEWVYREIGVSLMRYRRGAAGSLGEAFAAPDHRGSPQRGERKKMMISHAVWKYMFLARREDKELTVGAACELAKKKFLISPSIARDYYYEWERAFKAFDAGKLRMIRMSGAAPKIPK